MDADLTLTLQAVPDDELLKRLVELVSQSRRVEADLVAHIGEVDERRLFARQAFPSMFAYCIESLHLSEAEAYRRITVARVARKHPAILKALRDGRLHLSGLVRLMPLVNADNCTALLERASHLTTRQIEHLVTELAPRPDVPSVIRKLPQKRQRRSVVAVEASSLSSAAELFPERVEAQTAEPPPHELVARRVVTLPAATPQALPTLLPSRPAVVEPLAPARFKVQFTASSELRDKLERLTALLRTEVPDGDLEAVIDRAVTDTLERLEARRFGKTVVPRKMLAGTDTSAASRHIPAAVRRAVRERDGERCGFVDEQGRRCSERYRLEFHHRHPFAMGGDHRPDNIGLLCPQHNRFIAERDYGRAAIRRWIGGHETAQSGSGRERQPEP
jgi:HNH endonuclease